MNSYLQKVLADKNLSYESGLAKRFLIEYYSHQKDFSSAISTANEVLSSLNSNKGETSDSSLTCDILYAKGYIYAHDLDNKDEAVKCFSDIMSNYPDNSLVTLAENELELLGVDVGKIAKEKPKVENKPGFSTSSYPNPFNPTTIINYTLPDNERVVIKVYDILGREVKELVNEQKAAGTYSVEFDGSKLSSGVYFYTITAGQFSQTKKMVLTK
jgi:tetratricopeptide (TPR) repeat protein